MTAPRPRRAAVALVAVLALARPVAAASPDEPRALTLAAAVELTLTGSRDIAGAQAGLAAADARVSGARAQRLPVLSTEANVLFWDKELTFELGGMLPEGTDNTIRDRVTASFTATLAQPLSGLLVISRLIGVERAGARAARADVDRVRLDAAARTAEIYLRVLQARASQEVAEKSLAQIEAQLARAQVLEKGGVLGAVDVLRLSSAREAARLGVLRARTGARTALRGLALAIGLDPQTDLAVSDDLPTPPPAPALTEDDAVVRAAKQRPELAAAAARIDQAENGRLVAKAGYLPNILAVASYSHTEGQGTFQSPDAWYLGVTLSWNLWDWGKTGSAVDEAAARRRQAEIGAAGLADAVEVEVRSRALEAQTAHESIAVTSSALSAAEEAYRIQSVRFQAGDATTTDLLEAETVLARARSEVALARYDYFVSRVALSRAVGELPDLLR